MVSMSTTTPPPSRRRPLGRDAPDTPLPPLCARRLLFLTVAFIDVPHAAGDPLLRWWQHKSNCTAGIPRPRGHLRGAVFAGRRRIRLPAGSRSPYAVLGVCGGRATVTAVRPAIGCFVDFLGRAAPGPDTLRLATALNYSLLGLSPMAGSRWPSCRSR